MRRANSHVRITVAMVLNKHGHGPTNNQRSLRSAGEYKKAGIRQGLPLRPPNVRNPAYAQTKDMDVVQHLLGTIRRTAR